MNNVQKNMFNLYFDKMENDVSFYKTTKELNNTAPNYGFDIDAEAARGRVFNDIIAFLNLS